MAFEKYVSLSPPPKIVCFMVSKDDHSAYIILYAKILRTNSSFYEKEIIITLKYLHKNSTSNNNTSVVQIYLMEICKCTHGTEEECEPFFHKNL